MVLVRNAITLSEFPLVCFAKQLSFLDLCVSLSPSLPSLCLPRVSQSFFVQAASIRLLCAFRAPKIEVRCFQKIPLEAKEALLFGRWHWFT